MSKVRIFNKLLSLIVASLLMLSIVFLFIKVYEKDKVFFVNISTLMIEFNYAKELDLQYNDILIQRENEIEEKQILLNQMASEISEFTEEDINNYKKLESEIQNLIKSYYEDKEIIESEYNQLIIERLNEYVYKYGEEHDIKIILGATGTGNIMYAEKDMDITDDVLIYINSKYEGK
ncbi:MAG: OmpH family outer membrane protein [Candidatus Delongbacteria bacterium]|nr:OmpH family outer membrane protein [Candidatus Delongbacteria bacterium]